MLNAFAKWYEMTWVLEGSVARAALMSAPLGMPTPSCPASARSEVYLAPFGGTVKARL